MWNRTEIDRYVYSIKKGVSLQAVPGSGLESWNVFLFKNDICDCLVARGETLKEAQKAGEEALTSGKYSGILDLNLWNDPNMVQIEDIRDHPKYDRQSEFQVVTFRNEDGCKKSISTPASIPSKSALSSSLKIIFLARPITSKTTNRLCSNRSLSVY